MKRAFFLPWGVIMMMNAMYVNAGDNEYALRIVPQFASNQNGLIPLVPYVTFLNQLQEVVKKHEGAVIDKSNEAEFIVKPHSDDLLCCMLKRVNVMPVAMIEVIKGGNE